MYKQDIAHTTPRFPVDWGKISKEEARQILCRVRGLSEEVRERLMKITSS